MNCTLFYCMHCQWQLHYMPPPQTQIAETRIVDVISTMLIFIIMSCSYSLMLYQSFSDFSYEYIPTVAKYSILWDSHLGSDSGARTCDDRTQWREFPTAYQYPSMLCWAVISDSQSFSILQGWSKCGWGVRIILQFFCITGSS